METNEKNLISRREAIKKAAMVFGGVLSTPAALTLLQGCSQPGPSLSRFTDSERATIDTIADIIIPTTDTPGATESGAVQLMEDILFAIWEEDDKNYFLDNLADFEAQASRELGGSFSEASAEDQVAYINKVHDEVFRVENVDWSDPKPFIWQMKEGIVHAYFGTEVGMSQVNQYNQVPGSYDPCVSFEEAGEGGRVWANY